MVWKTKDGRFIEIRQLSDDHLSNIVTMLRRDGYVTEDEWFAELARMCCGSESSTYEAGRNFDEMKTHTVAEAIFEEYEIRQFMKSQERVLEA